MKIHYNSPVVLTFSLFATAVLLMNNFFGGILIQNYFVAYGTFDPFALTNYWRIFSHALGHANWEHLISNLSFLLLLGPLVEEKYGSAKTLIMILFTAGITGIANILFFETGLLGASGIVFMLIVLSSATNLRARTIPLTMIFVALLYIGREFVNAFSVDSISQFGHIAGGVCGAFFGLLFKTTDDVERENY